MRVNWPKNSIVNTINALVYENDLADSVSLLVLSDGTFIAAVPLNVGHMEVRAKQ